MAKWIDWKISLLGNALIVKTTHSSGSSHEFTRSLDMITVPTTVTQLLL